MLPKMDTSQNIKDYMTVQGKNTGKAKPTEHANSNSKQHNKNTSMVKEACPNDSKPKHKTPKNTKENKLTTDPKQNNQSIKQDSSMRRPLEGNPGKKHKENSENNKTEELDKSDKSTEKEQIEDTINTSAYSEINASQSTTTEPNLEKDIPNWANFEANTQGTTMEILLKELKSIKETIQQLDAKVDTSYNDLSKSALDNIELKRIITAQNARITLLFNENMELKQRNKTLEKDFLDIEEEMLRLKVNISGIPKSPYETYEHLRSKIVEIMMTVSEGKTEQARWETSSNIPLTDCRRLGTYNKKGKELSELLSYL